MDNQNIEKQGDSVVINKPVTLNKTRNQNKRIKRVDTHVDQEGIYKDSTGTIVVNGVRRESDVDDVDSIIEMNTSTRSIE